MENQVETIKYTPEKAKQNALAKLDLIRKWQEFSRKAVNKLQADYDFVKLHNSSDSYLFNVLGKISRGSLHRWKASLDGTEDYTRLIPNYKYVSKRICKSLSKSLWKKSQTVIKLTIR